jgi:hypothetical protein
VLVGSRAQLINVEGHRGRDCTRFEASAIALKGGWELSIWMRVYLDLAVLVPQPVHVVIVSRPSAHNSFHMKLRDGGTHAIEDVIECAARSIKKQSRSFFGSQAHLIRSLQIQARNQAGQTSGLMPLLGRTFSPTPQ